MAPARAEGGVVEGSNGVRNGQSYRTQAVEENSQRDTGLEVVEENRQGDAALADEREIRAAVAGNVQNEVKAC